MIDTDVIDLLDSRRRPGIWAHNPRRPPRSSQRSCPPRRRLARRNSDRGCSARGLGLPRRPSSFEPSSTRPRHSRRTSWKAGTGRFVLISAGQAQAPTHPNAAYAAAKAASETWTLALADRFRGTGADGERRRGRGDRHTTDARREPRQGLLTFTPAEEIAEAVVYLGSDAAASMNGQRLTLRGAV